MLFNNRKKKLSNFRLRYKGYAILKEQNKLGLWRELKEQFLFNSPVEKNTKFSKLIFGSSYKNADLIIHQFCVDRFLPNWLEGQILENLANPSSKITKPLPNNWVKILVKNKFNVNYFVLNLKFRLYIFKSFLYNIKFIFGILFRSLSLKENNFYDHNSIFFINLSVNNFPSNLKNGKSYDIISWFFDSKLINTKIIYHDVKEMADFIYKGVKIKYQHSPLSFFGEKGLLFKFFIWALKSILISFFDLLNGRWYHALILAEASYNKIFELKKCNNFSKAYYFQYSSQCYRPMWTYNAIRKGIEITSYFYSTFDQPAINGYFNNQKFEFYLFNWPNVLVWDNYQYELLRNNSKFEVNQKIVGPIYFTDSNKVIPTVKNFTIAVFDSQVPRKYFHFGASTLGEYYELNPNTDIQFLKDIVACMNKFNFTILHKTKRNIGNRSRKSYLNYLNKITYNNNYLQVDPSLSAIKVINNSDIIISSPFTSTAIYGIMQNKSSFYYDPSGWIQKNDPAAHGIPIISGIDELEKTINKFLIQNI